MMLDMKESETSRGVGRPGGSETRPMESKFNLYRTIEAAREREFRRTGRRPSVNKICGWIVRQGGYHEFIACEKAQEFPKSDKVQLGRVNDAGTGIQIDRDGDVFLTNSVQSADSLRRRYYEAKEYLSENDLLEVMVRQIGDIFGEPRPIADWSLGWLAPQRIIPPH